jgi:hypothetical protein
VGTHDWGEERRHSDNGKAAQSVATDRPFCQTQAVEMNGRRPTPIFATNFVSEEPALALSLAELDSLLRSFLLEDYHRQNARSTAKQIQRPWSDGKKEVSFGLEDAAQVPVGAVEVILGSAKTRRCKATDAVRVRCVSHGS